MSVDASRSSTDPVTNVVLLADTRLEEDLPQLTALGEGPERLLPSFLHEATHYWCFNSSVGQALAILQMRIHRAAAEYAGSRDQRSTHDLAESLNRYETAVGLLHPLDEGMALFAEFDLVTRKDSRVWSQPLELAAAFFRRPPLDPQVVDGDFFVTAWGQGVIQKMRLGAEILDRKVNVLGLPLTCAGDAYLPGYLLVRQLWLSALRREWRLASETDLFLMYLRTFLYEDMALIAILLDSSLDEVRGANAVLHRIMGRLQQFTGLDPSYVARFEDITAKDDADLPRQLWTTLGQTPADIEVGERRLLEALDENDQSGHESLQDALRFHERQVLLRRQLLYVGSWKVDVEVADGHFRVSSGGEVLREGAARGKTLTGSGPGFVDVLQWVPRRERVVAVIRDGQVVATQSLFHGIDNDPELVALVGERDEVLERLQALDDVVNAVVQDTWVKIAVDHIRQALAANLDQMYLPLALADVPDAKLETTTNLMGQEGFYPLFNYDRSIIEGLAALGICCSTLSPYESWASAFLKNKGLSYEKTLAAADVAFDTYGVGRVWRQGGALLPSV
jgi:hypothetical protein